MSEPEAQDAPDTVTEAVEFLEAAGYRDELRFAPGGLACDAAPGVQPVTTAVVDYTFRFEGPSDPADEAIVLGITCPEWGLKGVLIAGFGASADPDDAALLRALVRSA